MAVKLEFELEDLKGMNLLIDGPDGIEEAHLCEIRKENYVKFLINSETVWMEIEDFAVVDILN